MGQPLTANSNKICRHAPQGGHNRGPGTKINASAMSRSPAMAIEEIAFFSAQQVKEYDAFSTFTPENILPDLVRILAATGKLEYGA